MSLTISHWNHFSKKGATKNGISILEDNLNNDITPEDLYRHLQLGYPKFFKMDMLCKWAWLGAENLLKEEQGFSYEGIDKNKIAIVLATAHGCLDVDKKYLQSTLSIPSPALFVYTLSNIMLGEVSIRHGFKGEQTCFVNDTFDVNELYFWVNDLMTNRNMEACLCGWVDATNDEHDVCLFWVNKNENGLNFTPSNLLQLYKS